MPSIRSFAAWRTSGRDRRVGSLVALCVAVVATVGLAGFVLGGGARDALPPEKQSAFDRIAQDQAIGRANPAPKQPDATPPQMIVPALDPPQFPGVQTSLAGAGVIIESQMAPPGAKNSIWVNLWQEQGATRSIGVSAGAVADDPQQGLVDWVQSGPAPSFANATGAELRTPTRSGAVRVIAASGEVLTLRAADGTLFTFDAQAGAFR